MSCANLLSGAVALSAPKLVIPSLWAGQVTLAAGTAAVAIPFLPAGAVPVLSPVSAAVGASNDALAAGVITNPGAATAAFQIYSADNTDVRVVRYVCFAQA
jgi:hypothetical protein